MENSRVTAYWDDYNDDHHNSAPPDDRDWGLRDNIYYECNPGYFLLPQPVSTAAAKNPGEWYYWQCRTGYLWRVSVEEVQPSFIESTSAPQCVKGTQSYYSEVS